VHTASCPIAPGAEMKSFFSCSFLIGVSLSQFLVTDAELSASNTVDLDQIFDYAQYSVNRFLNWYDFSHGVFIGHISYGPDWCRGNSMTALCDYILYSPEQNSGDDYVWNILQEMQDNQGDNFYQTAEYFDDVLWWCLAYTRAYHVAIAYNNTERAHRFLSTAISIHDVVTKDSCSHSTACNGGCYWSRAFSYKNAITNELYFSAATNLAILTNNHTFFTRANDSITWLMASGMLNGDSLFVDGLDNDINCKAGGGIYTYNQGVVLGGLANMQILVKNQRNLHTNDARIDYITLGDNIVSAVMAKMTNTDGVLVETSCGDGALFKGIFTRYLRYFIDNSNTKYADKYISFLSTQLNSLWYNNRDERSGLFGKAWFGPATGEHFHNLQVSGIDLINSLSGLTSIAIHTQDINDQCSGHGALLNSICYCDTRYSGAQCETESNWLNFYDGIEITLTSKSVGKLLCAVRSASVTTCLSDDLMAESTLRIAAVNSSDLSPSSPTYLITTSGGYVGYDAATDEVVVFAREDSVSEEFMQFIPVVVTVDNSAPKSVSPSEYVTFKSGVSGRYVTVAENAVSVNMLESMTDGALFVTNLKQEC
jgi:predicted alpha-1,6-mannanase (GH76 family)